MAGRPRLISVSGNSGAGKSTLLRRLESDLSDAGFDVVRVDERELHHPRLQRMFDSPPEWAYTVQVNFILQRSAMLRHLNETLSPERGVVVMERSLLEDPLFLEFHADAGSVSPSQRAAYYATLDELRVGIGSPDVILHLKAPAQVLLDRLALAVREGHRDRELPDEPLRRYISDMNDRYDEWGASRPAGPRYLEIDVSGPAGEPTALARAALRHAREGLPS